MLSEVRVRSEHKLVFLASGVDGSWGAGVSDLLSLGEADSAARDAAALSFYPATLTVCGLRVFGLVMIILSFVDDH